MEENKKAMAQAILLLSEQKDTLAEPILKELAANGDVEAKFTLAGLYLSGGNGSPLAIYLAVLKCQMCLPMLNMARSPFPLTLMMRAMMKKLSHSHVKKVDITMD